MTLQPAVVLGLVGVEIVENDMDLPTGVLGDDAVHEVEKLDPAAALVLAPADLASGHVERCLQGRRAMSLVIIGLSCQRPAAPQLQITLLAFQRLDRRFSSTLITMAFSVVSM